MIVAIAPIVVAVIGALVYALASNAKASELGRIAYFAGTIVLVAVLAQHTVHLP